MRYARLRTKCFLLLILSLTATAASIPFSLQDTDPPLAIYTSPEAGKWEQQAARDLKHYIERMGLPAPTVRTDKFLAPGSAVILGERALEENGKLRNNLAKVTKKNAVVRSDAVAYVIEDSKLYLAGSNDESHYFAVSELLHRWGCRWYLPTEFGECIPARKSLTLESTEYSYASPFEVRAYWLSWLGDSTGHELFARRNFFNQVRPGGSGGHTSPPEAADGNDLLSYSYVKAWVEKLSPTYSVGKDASVAMPDKVLTLSTSNELALSGKIWDKYFQTHTVTDLYLELYNRIGSELKRLYPDSGSLLGFLAYSNLTLPPQRVLKTESNLLCYLAPIDIDPNHAFGDPRSPSKNDYWGAAKRWARVMQGRVIIYDYDQSMLVWRDLPNPSHHVISKDVKAYHQMGILGFSTESRGALATTFTNLHFRGQLYWNPDYDVAASLEEFYSNFYGLAAPVMRSYWQQIFEAWENTGVTEHEFFVIPTIYAESIVQNLQATLEPLSRLKLQEPYASRVEFTRLGFEVMHSYSVMTHLASSECNYLEAARVGERGLSSREKLTEMSPLFTTYKKMGEKGPAWWPGEVEMYRELGALFENSKGRALPLEWDFRLDPNDEGVWRNWSDGLEETRKVRSDLYLQAQGVIQSNGHPHNGFGWYQCELVVPPGNWSIVFPGLFNEAWLYCDGRLLSRREQRSLWWGNDYKFQWRVDLPEFKTKSPHRFTLRVPMTVHAAGMFRRPFLIGSDGLKR